MEIVFKNTQENNHFRIYRYRWVILICFSLASCQNMMVWTMFSPIQTLMKNSYLLSLTVINFGTTVIENVLAIPGTLLANYIFDTHGIRPGLVLATVLTIIGIWLRVFCDISFWFIVAGQTFSGLAQPLYINTTQTISNIWFGPNERTISTSIMNVVLTLTGGLGSLIPQFFITAGPGDLAKSQIKEMCIFVAWIGTILSLPTLIFVKSKPPSPPCQAAEVERLGFKESLKGIFKNGNSFLFLIASGLVYGANLSQSIIFQPQLKPFGITNDDAGNIYGISNFIAPLFFMLTPVLIKYFKGFKNALLFSFFLETIFILGFAAFSYTESLWPIAVYFCFLQISFCPPITLSLEYIVELSYPVGETTAGGMYTVIAEQFSTVMCLVCDYILRDESKSAAILSYLILGGFSLIGSILMIFVKNEMKRSNLENENSEKLLSINS